MSQCLIMGFYEVESLRWKVSKFFCQIKVKDFIFLFHVKNLIFKYDWLSSLLRLHPVISAWSTRPCPRFPFFVHYLILFLKLIVNLMCILRCLTIFFLLDLYTFHSSEEDARVTYEEVTQAYEKILNRLQLQFVKGWWAGHSDMCYIMIPVSPVVQFWSSGSF